MGIFSEGMVNVRIGGEAGSRFLNVGKKSVERPAVELYLGLDKRRTAMRVSVVLQRIHAPGHGYPQIFIPPTRKKIAREHGHGLNTLAVYALRMGLVFFASRSAPGNKETRAANDNGD